VRIASAGAGKAFAEELAQQVARLAAKYHDETAAGGRRYRFFSGRGDVARIDFAGDRT
jgi:hypothetical protein